MTTPAFDQADYDIRCEWGEQGLRALAAGSDAIILVDVLSFCTAVTIGVEQGATIYPYRFKDASAEAFAQAHNAQLALGRGEGKYSLSPASMQQATAGERIVLPGPNGAALALLAAELNPAARLFAGCIRNATAVARAAAGAGRRISVIPCGERWPDHSLRPAMEDLLGAGMIIERLTGRKSPEARLAQSSSPFSAGELRDLMWGCGSARELANRGYGNDVKLAFQTDYSKVAPVLADGAFIRA